MNVIPDYTFITPLPPQKTGIADYADGLISSLRQVGRVIRTHTQSRFCCDQRTDCLPLTSFDPTKSPPDRTVYQIGNNIDFHDEQILNFLRHGGIVHLHDPSLHHVFIHFTEANPAIYYGLLRKWYGAEVEEKARKYRQAGESGIWERPETVLYPLHEEVIARSCRVIVHSEFAKSMIQRRFPTKLIKVLPQTFPGATPSRRSRNGPLRLCSLGFVTRPKNDEAKIMAVSICRDNGVRVDLEIGGELSAECNHLPHLVERLGLSDRIRFHGWVSLDRLKDFLEASDACIVFRDPTVGEASGITSRALQLGTPLVVNDVGYYSELPDHVPKLPTGSGLASKLAELIQVWAHSPALYESISGKAYNFALSEVRHESVVSEYDAFIRAAGSQG